MNSYSKIVIYVSCAFLIQNMAFADGRPEKTDPSLAKSQMHSTGIFDGNRVSAELENNGLFVTHRVTGQAGMSWPMEDPKTSMYASGLWLTGMVDGEVRTATSEYGTEWSPGAWGSNDTLPSYRLYKVNQTDLQDPAANPDFAAWPIAQGAPWVDVDGDGIYTPLPEGLDHPDFIGDQVIFYIMNDGIDDNHVIFNTDPLDLEVRVTIWGYADQTTLEDMMFVKTQIYHKGSEHIQDLIMGIWSDPDVYQAGNDRVGCDPSSGLGYVYDDALADPHNLGHSAVGVRFLQLAAPSMEDDANAYAFDAYTPGYSHLQMGAFVRFDCGGPIFTDPNDAQEAYNWMSGIDGSGGPIIDPTTGLATRFVCPGDPLMNIDENDFIWIHADDGYPCDARMLQGSEPFDLAPGDSAEMIAVFINALGPTPLSAITPLRVAGEMANTLYQHYFSQTIEMLPPVVTATPSRSTILLEWDDTADSYESGGIEPYMFEGYNIFQHAGSDPHSSKIKIATYDRVNGVRDVFDQVLQDVSSAYVYSKTQDGRDVGVQHFLNIDSDSLNNGAALIDDRVYYFSVSAYTHNARLYPKSQEASSPIIAVRPQKNVSSANSFATFGDTLEMLHQGSADGGAIARVINPSELKNDQYEIYFDQQHYYRNIADVWTETNYADSVGRIAKRSDVSASSMSGACMVYGVEPGTYDLVFTVDFQSSGCWADGLVIDLPDEANINGWTQISGSYNSYGSAQGQNDTNPDGTLSAGNVLTWGDQALSGFGAIEGDDSVTVNINEIVFPIIIDYTIWDDGYDAVDLDATGSITIHEVGYEFMSIKHWNLKNSQGALLLEDQTILGDWEYQYIDEDGQLLWPAPNPYRRSGHEVGTASLPVIDGFQVSISGTYDPPISYADVQLNGSSLSGGGAGTQWADDTFRITDFMYFGYPDGGAMVSLPAYAAGASGTSSLDMLQQDYELRWNGVLADTTIGSNTIQFTRSGGQMVTCFGASSYDIADHPMNPNPGSTDPFALRVPFEIWNVDEDQQVNMLYWDRLGNPTVDGGMTWYTENRQYGWCVNTPYSDTALDPLSQEVADNATWNWVFYQSNFNMGDALSFTYTNPLILGIDSYVFSTTAPVSKALDLDMIKVWPNPYFTRNPEEQSYFDSRIHFINLPDEATITIVNLAGQVIRVLEHSGSQETIWDVRTAHNHQFGSGVYIAIIDTQHGKQVLKLAVVARNI